MKRHWSSVSFVVLLLLIGNSGWASETNRVISSEQWIAFSKNLKPFGECIDAYIARNKFSFAEIGMRLAANGKTREFLNDAVSILGPSSPFASNLVDPKLDNTQRIPLALVGLGQLALSDTASRTDKVRALGTARVFEAGVTNGECVPTISFINIVNSTK
jgi:hypothetical protein